MGHFATKRASRPYTARGSHNLCKLTEMHASYCGIYRDAFDQTIGFGFARMALKLLRQCLQFQYVVETSSKPSWAILPHLPAVTPATIFAKYSFIPS